MEGSITKSKCCLRLVLVHCANRNVATVIAFLAELNDTIGQSIEGMIFTDTYVLTWVVLGTTLADDNITGDASLTSENFHAEAFRM